MSDKAATHEQGNRAQRPIARSHSDAPFARQARPSGSGPVALIILDGFGWRGETTGNAVAEANKPVFDALWAKYPHTTLQASERAVGLPDGQFGNSEVGHSNIGAGRILYQDLTRINLAIENGDFNQNDAFVAAMSYARDEGQVLHLAGLLSNGGVHSHIDHLLALLRLAKQLDVPRVFVHAILDGRDVPPTTGVGFLRRLQDEMASLGVGQIASVSGRYYAMDRDNRWQRTEKAYRAMVYGTGGQVDQVRDPISAVEDSYAAEVTDEFIIPMAIIDGSGHPVGPICDNDTVIFFNFRPDRAIQLTEALTAENFSGFDRGPSRPHVRYVSMTRYSEAFEGRVEVAYSPTQLHQTMGEVLALHGLTQLRIAETEKFPHVTYFYSGGQETMFPGEERILVPSPQVATYDLKPEMSAATVATEAAGRLRTGAVDVMILNFANPDMVGHTGDLQAAIRAVEAVDTCLGQVLEALESVNGIALVTADHGNADIMIDPNTGGPCTTHTTSLVPFILTKLGVTVHPGILADLAPTMLDLLGVPQPAEMTGKTLIDH